MQAQKEGGPNEKRYGTIELATVKGTGIRRNLKVPLRQGSASCIENGGKKHDWENEVSTEPRKEAKE
jgi:hypothetical protein